MKRNVNLQDLSRDHHHGLLLGWKLRQGIKKNASVEVMKDYVSYFFREALKPHFLEEEEILFSHLPNGNEHKERALGEHVLIEKSVAGFSPDTSQQDLLSLADQLDRHIRYEEQKLFPYLEQHLNENELQELGTILKQHHHPFNDSFPYEFWK